MHTVTNPPAPGRSATERTLHPPFAPNFRRDSRFVTVCTVDCGASGAVDEASGRGVLPAARGLGPERLPPGPGYRRGAAAAGERLPPRSGLAPGSGLPPGPATAWPALALGPAALAPPPLRRTQLARLGRGLGAGAPAVAGQLGSPERLAHRGAPARVTPDEERDAAEHSDRANGDREGAAGAEAAASGRWRWGWWRRRWRWRSSWSSAPALWGWRRRRGWWRPPVGRPRAVAAAVAVGAEVVVLAEADVECVAARAAAGRSAEPGDQRHQRRHIPDAAPGHQRSEARGCSIAGVFGGLR